MHVVFRESHGLEETDTPFDLGQDPADLVVLSFSDSDLGAFAAGFERMRRVGSQPAAAPTLRLANIVALKHPVSVDTYAERTLAGAKAILVRLIGGEAYWPYGLATLQDLARRQGTALAILPADGRPDPRLDELSTLPVSTLRRLQALCDEGGAVAAHAALAQLALAAGLYVAPVTGDKTVPQMGFYDPEKGVIPAPESANSRPGSDPGRDLLAATRQSDTSTRASLPPARGGGWGGARARQTFCPRQLLPQLPHLRRHRTRRRADPRPARRRLHRLWCLCPQPQGPRRCRLADRAPD